MATITAIEKQKRRPRLDIELDGGLAFSIRLDLAAERHLTVGQALTPAARRELEAEDGRRDAMAAALRLIASAPRSEKDLRDRLGRRDLPPAAVDAAVARLRELGYLNDAAYASFFVEARQASTPRSRRALTFELARKGVDRETSQAAVATLSDEEAAYAAAQRRLRALRSLDREAFRRWLGVFLTSRGFGYGVARATVERCLAELSEADAAT